MHRIQAWLPEEHLREVQRLAKEHRVSVSAIIRRGVKRALQEQREAKASRADQARSGGAGEA
jgi:Arc/MetJ-type ribon-helix-helix transcriptional regulator